MKMILAASGIILKDKKILLVKRSKKSMLYPETWVCPGGRGNPNETPEQIVVREVKEEVNLDFQPTQLLKKTVHKERELFRFLGTWSGKIKIQKEELTQYGWFSYKETKALNLGFEYRYVIEDLHKKELI